MTSCGGCLTHKVQQMSETILCQYTKYNKTGSCPCTICLVKSMCENGCETRDKWLNKLNRDSKCRKIKNQPRM